MRQLPHLTLDDGSGLLSERILISLMSQQMHGVQDRRKGVAEFMRQHRQELVLATTEVG